MVRLQQSDRLRGHRVLVLPLCSSTSRIDPMTYKLRGHESVIVAKLPTLNFHPSTTLHTRDVCHAISDTRPSPFSACNIENVGVAWGRGYLQPIPTVRVLPIFPIGLQVSIFTIRSILLQIHNHNIINMYTITLIIHIPLFPRIARILWSIASLAFFLI